jgi:hypothetical protein
MLMCFKDSVGETNPLGTYVEWLILAQIGRFRQNEFENLSLGS